MGGGHLQLLEATSLQPVRDHRLAGAHGRVVQSVKYTSNGDRVVVSISSAFHILDSLITSVLKTVRFESPACGMDQFILDGCEQVAFCFTSPRAHIKCFDMETYTESHEIPLDGNFHLQSFTFTPRGLAIFCGTDLCILEFPSLRRVAEIRLGHPPWASMGWIGSREVLVLLYHNLGVYVVDLGARQGLDLGVQQLRVLAHSANIRIQEEAELSFPQSVPSLSRGQNRR